MFTPQLILDLNHELVVDNFAGGGGASTGIERALGRYVDHAINHDRLALGMHRINHPQTVHHCEDVFEIDPRTLTEGRPVGAAWFSPDCKHFSKAKGGKPLSKKIRGLVLVMLRWAKIRTRVLFMENVEEITTWGPLIEIEKNGTRGWYPDPAHKGRTWRAFLDCLGTGIEPDHPDLPEILDVLDGTVTQTELVAGFGYAFQYRELRACDYGAPTVRNRLFMVARCDGQPIVWPKPTHADPARQGPPLLPWRTIAECIDWQRPCPSIFLSGAAAKAARCKRPLAPATLRRIAKGIERYVLHASRPFLVSLTHQGGDRVEDIDAPINTITGAHRGEKAVVAPLITEHAHAANQRNMPADEPMRTLCAGVKGGHFALISGSVVNTCNGECDDAPSRSIDPGSPLPTVTASQKFAAVTGTLVHVAHGEQDSTGKKRRGRGAHDVSECMPTICASPDGALAAATLVQTGYGERKGQEPRALDPDKPLGTVVAGGGKHAVAAASLVKLRGTNIGHGVEEPLHTVSAGGTHHGVVAAYVAQHNGGFNELPGRPATEPVSTLSSRGSQQQVVAASVIRHFGKSVGQDVESPAPTVMAGGQGKTGIVAASVAAYYGSEQDGQAVTEPMRTSRTKGHLSHVESCAVPPPMTPEQIAGAIVVAQFLRDQGVEFEGEFATVAGHVIVDIGMRMLTPRELFRAQGFPEDYVIDKAWIMDPHTCALSEVELTKEQQICRCGNSVCPPVAEALVRANVPELIVTWQPPPLPGCKPPSPKKRRAHLATTAV